MTAQGTKRAAALAAVGALGVTLAGCNLGEPATTYDVPKGRDVELVDVDLDGDLDVVTSGMAVPVSRGENRYDRGVLVNDGSGRFTVLVQPTAAIDAIATEVGDVTADTLPDRVDLARVGGYPLVVVSDGTGDGGFGYTREVIRFAPPLTEVPADITLADVDGDGKNDLVTAGEELIVWEGVGDGGFGGVTRYPLFPNPSSFPEVTVEAVDVDADGDADVVASGGPADVSQVKVFENDGAGGLGTPATLLPADHGSRYNSTGFAVADIDEDGHLDIVRANGSTTAVSLFRGDGTGGFAAAEPLEIGRDSYRLESADIDGDGHVDLIVTYPTAGSTTTVHFGDGDGGFADTHELGTKGPPVKPLVGDLDGDGRDDVVIANGPAEPTQWPFQDVTVDLNRLEGRTHD